ncbi:winged helix-turn-helix domain-containing protein [Bradyrhizobium sp. CB82]|uniref:ATP-binding protein n=1 Tax=Bradyrhizobium sp. CB82 TaxID=3039159 RepID=UPI0024B0DF3D|nr:winged helix-turn-helix domain-containing protein [Bradyrhizobium sp. CB82]WFU42326.1 winged helix-turn-helix domain-containing protein [Bradyrhizobium sp. CB82]
MAAPPAQSNETVSFGPFLLVPGERMLTKEGARVELSARAYDILVTLLSRPNEVVSKNDLIAEVWPGLNVEEGALRFHVAGLRKALGDGKDGARYISTLSGRGYSFVAATSRSGITAQSLVAPSPGFHHYNLPSRLGAMIDREEDLEKLSLRLNAYRFVTIVGSGGVGKTTVAVAIAHQLHTTFDGAVLFVDLSMVSDPRLVTTGVASMLGLSVQSADAISGLIAFLRNKRLLLVLDTCEHLVDAVATLAVAIFRTAPQVHILATSRETLQADGEHVYRLEPLAYAPEGSKLSAEVARTFPATQLFVERAVASGANLKLNDAEAAIVADICRKLDGVALAIELAARRVEVYGLSEIAALLDQRLAQLWAGPRTAPPRQKTLQATLDWSYSLLRETERIVLRRLAIFVGNFTLDAALAVATGNGLDQAEVFEAIDSLVAKSMVATRSLDAVMRYRLLDTTRAYALELEADDIETASLAIRHARYHRQWLAQAASEWSTLMSGTERAPYFAGVSNVRTALEWCFGANGDLPTGIGLAAAAAPVLLAMSLLPECHHWSQRALAVLDDQVCSKSEQMHLQAGLGISSMLLYGENAQARGALDRSLALAEAERDVANEAGLLGMLHMFHFRSGDFNVALSYAKRCRALAANVDDPAALALAHSILGRSLLMMGDLRGARGELEALFADWSPSQQSDTIYLVHDRHFRAGIALARTLWMQGHPTQAVERAREFIDGAKRMDHPASVTVLLAWAASIFLWTGDFRSAQEYIDASIAISESYSLGSLTAVGRARKAQLAIRQGQNAIADLRASLAEIHAVRYELITTEFNICLTQGLIANGQRDDAMALLTDTILQVSTKGDTCYMPELLRMKGGLLRAMVPSHLEEAEACLMQSLELSRSQGALGWELRTAIDLAALLAAKGLRQPAKDVVGRTYGQFTEGFDTADLKAAERLLEQLS